jgi:hypothetical protein
MPQKTKHFQTLPHGELVTIFPEVLSVKGTMKLFGVFRYSRNMTVLKNGTSLILVNPVRLSPEGEEALLAQGSIDHILKIGSLHSVDIPYYMDTFSPKLWMLNNDKSLENYQADFFLNDHPVLPFLDLKVHVLEGSKIPESVLVLPSNGGVVLSCDSLVNMTADDEHANGLVRTLSKLLPKPTYIGPNWVKMAKPTKKSLTDILDFEFQHLVPAHGDPVLDTANVELERYFSMYKKWR